MTSKNDVLSIANSSKIFIRESLDRGLRPLGVNSFVTYTPEL